MSLPHRHRSPGTGQAVPAPSSDAIDVLVDAVSTGARPSPGTSTDDDDRHARSRVRLPRGTRRSWLSSRLARWIAPALVAFTIGLGGAVWSLRTLDSFAPQTDSVDVSPVPRAPVAPTTPPVAPPSPAPVDHLTSIELRPSAPFARVQHPRPARTSRTEGPGFLALSEVEGSLGLPGKPGGSPLRTATRAIASPIATPAATDALAPIATAPAPIDASGASPVPSAPEERSAFAERAATSTEAAEETAVRDTVEEYAQALEHLDVSAAAILWPSVDRRALSRAFASLKSQDVMFEECDVALTDTTATARCHGTAQYVVKVGPSGPRTGRYEWLFKMRKHDAAWKIEALSAWPMASGSRDQQ